MNKSSADYQCGYAIGYAVGYEKGEAELTASRDRYRAALQALYDFAEYAGGSRREASMQAFRAAAELLKEDS